MEFCWHQTTEIKKVQRIKRVNHEPEDTAGLLEEPI